MVDLWLNVMFAGLYLVEPGAIDRARPGSFADATMAAIGYGLLSPAGFYAKLVVTAETMVLLVFVALATGTTSVRAGDVQHADDDCTLQRRADPACAADGGVQ